jgi:hypothetical protein
MMRTLVKTGLAALGVLVLAGTAAAAEGDNPRNGGRKIAATLTGAAEVPGPGDTNGAGLFEARVNPGTGRICYDLDASSIDNATAAHIHKGAAGASGDVVLTLDTPDGDDDDSEECQDIDRGLAQALIQNTDQYYVNIHTTEFPNGAIRGQLGK